MIGAFDEFNRELIVEGTKEGLAATEKRGRANANERSVVPDGPNQRWPSERRQRAQH